jgi:hypothetical protein
VFVCPDTFFDFLHASSFLCLPGVTPEQDVSPDTVSEKFTYQSVREFSTGRMIYSTKKASYIYHYQVIMILRYHD